MEDILFSMPSYCDDCETWHQYHYWCYDDGTYTVCDEDGDHEGLDKADLPSQEEYDRLWREYRQWVKDTGEDPLGEFNVQHSVRRTERWEFKVFKSLVGPRLSAGRRAGHTYQPQEVAGACPQFP